MNSLSSLGVIRVRTEFNTVLKIHTRPFVCASGCLDYIQMTFLQLNYCTWHKCIQYDLTLSKQMSKLMTNLNFICDLNIPTQDMIVVSLRQCGSCSIISLSFFVLNHYCLQSKVKKLTVGVCMVRSQFSSRILWPNTDILTLIEILLSLQCQQNCFALFLSVLW